MTLVRYRYNHPANEFFNAARTMRSTNSEKSAMKPKANIIKEESHYKVQVALPGVEKENISMKVEKDVLIVTAKQNTEEQKYSMKEFDYSDLERRFILSDVVDQEKIKASYEYGILSIEVPLKEEANYKREIAIA